LGRFFLLMLGDHDAIEQFTAALALDSQCVEVQLDLVRAYLYSMRFEQARHLLDGLVARVGALTRVEHRSKAYDLHLQYFTRKAEFHQAVEHSADAALGEYENLLAAFGKIPPTAIDTHMKKHLAKAFPSACRCENDLSDDAQRKRLGPVVTWLSEFELPMLGPHSPKRQRLRGKVARIFKFKKFGFISRAGGEELFFHQGQFVRRSEWSAVAEGVEVEFEIGSNKQGDCAIRVRVVDTELENAATGKSTVTPDER
jgi:cold shock CspA family protein